MISLTYPDRTIRVPKGLTILEASYRHRVPHANVCGGKGRCSTCRVRILGDHSRLPQPSAREAFVLDHIGAGADTPRCVWPASCGRHRPRDRAVAVAAHRHLVRPWPGRHHPGEERYVVSMFVDMRGSTQIAADQLPFDTVFLVNRFLAAVAQAVTQAGGEVNQYLGDGLLALFGIRTSPPTACRQALHAAAMVGQRRTSQPAIAAARRDAIKFGIGTNGGEVIVGDIGYGDNIVFIRLRRRGEYRRAASGHDKRARLPARLFQTASPPTVRLSDDALPPRQIAIFAAVPRRSWCERSSRPRNLRRCSRVQGRGRPRRDERSPYCVPQSQDRRGLGVGMTGGVQPLERRVQADGIRTNDQLGRVAPAQMDNVDAAIVGPNFVGPGLVSSHSITTMVFQGPPLTVIFLRSK